METKITDAVNSDYNPLAGHNSYETGLVLSGGAARGFAHLGVFRALREMGIRPQIVSGVSAGAIAGAFYCDGFEPEEVLEIFNNTRILRFVKMAFNRQGLLNISGLRKLLMNNLRTKNIEDLKIPLIITATEIRQGTARFFTQGDLVNIIVASSSIPVIFKPAVIDGHIYVDGGINNNFPLEPLVNCCRELIGVHVNPIGMYNPKSGLIHMALRSFHLSVASGISAKKKSLTHFIEPLGLSEFSYYDIEGRQRMSDLGYQEAMKVLSAKVAGKSSLL